MKYIINLSILLLLMGLYSCSTSQYATVSKESKVSVYYKGHPPINKSFEIIGTIETSGWIFTSNERLLDGLQKKTEMVKADAVIDVEFGYIPHIVTGIPYVKGKAIRWK